MGLTIFTLLCNKSLEIFSFCKTENSVPIEISRFPLLSIPGSHYLFLYEIDYFPNSSVGKQSACNAGDPGSIPGSGRFPGDGIGYPLQYSWASLVAQLVKNPPAMQETWVQFLGWKDPQEKGKAAHSSILSWRIPWTPWGHKELDMTERLSLRIHTFTARAESYVFLWLPYFNWHNVLEIHQYCLIW